MLRRMLITNLTLVAICLAILGWVGYAVPIYQGVSVLKRIHVYVFFADGLVRFYGYRSSEDTYLETSEDYRRMTFRRSADGSVCQVIAHALPWRLPPYALVSTKFRPRGGSTGPTLRLVGARTWIWLPIVSMLAYPLTALVRDRIRHHRRKPGHCRGCGYDLTGNTSGVCPECGMPSACGTCGCNLTESPSGGCPECSSPA